MKNLALSVARGVAQLAGSVLFAGLACAFIVEEWASVKKWERDASR